MRQVRSFINGFEQHIRDRNARDRYRALSREVANLPPERTDGICRWCGCQTKVLGDSKQTVICPSGCADDPIHRHQCSLCRQTFFSGWGRADTCYRCTEQEKRESGSPLPRRDAWRARHHRIHGDEGR